MSEKTTVTSAKPSATTFAFFQASEIEGGEGNGEQELLAAGVLDLELSFGLDRGDVEQEHDDARSRTWRSP
jgi:hypothetical protein